MWASHRTLDKDDRPVMDEHDQMDEGERSFLNRPSIGAQKTTIDHDSGDQAGEQDPPTSSRLRRDGLEPAVSITAAGGMGPLPAATAVLPDAITNLLWHWGLCINYELKILVCWTCHHGIHSTPHRIMSHLEKYHSIKGQTVKKRNPDLLSNLELGLGGFPFSNPEKVKQQPANRAPIPEIEVNSGFYCPLLNGDKTKCQAAYPEGSSLYKHCKTAHSSDMGRLKPKAALNYPCDC